MTETGQKEAHSYNLTNHVDLGVRGVEPGETLTIVERWQFDKHLFLSLAVPNEPAKATQLRLWWLLKSGQNHYCVLVQLAWLFDDDPMQSHMVLRIMDQNTLATIGNDELERISADCRAAIEAAPHSKEADVAFLMGNFPEVEI